MLHEFTIFVINNATAYDKKLIINYLSGLLSLAFADQPNTDDIIKYALKDQDTLAIIVAYLVKYMDEYDLASDDIDKLLEMLGLDSLDEYFAFEVFGKKIVGLADIIDYMKTQLTDNDDDLFISNIILPALKGLYFDDLNIDIKRFWNKVNSKVKAINVTKGIENYPAKMGGIHDFSRSVYDILMNVIDKISDLNYDSTSAWNHYAEYEWFSQLSIFLMVKGIALYSNSLIEMNNQNRQRIEVVFDNVYKMDESNAAMIEQQNSYIKSIRNGLLNIMCG